MSLVLPEAKLFEFGASLVYKAKKEKKERKKRQMSEEQNCATYYGHAIGLSLVRDVSVRRTSSSISKSFLMGSTESQGKLGAGVEVSL